MGGIRWRANWPILLSMLQCPRMQDDEPKTLDLSRLLDRSHENKWVAFAPDYSKVVAASESLIELDKLVVGKNVVFYRVLPYNAIFAPASPVV